MDLGKVLKGTLKTIVGIGLGVTAGTLTELLTDANNKTIDRMVDGKDIIGIGSAIYGGISSSGSKVKKVSFKKR